MGVITYIVNSLCPASNDAIPPSLDTPEDGPIYQRLIGAIAHIGERRIPDEE
jgi:hypothetical protein